MDGAAPMLPPYDLPRWAESVVARREPVPRERVEILTGTSPAAIFAAGLVPSWSYVRGAEAGAGRSPSPAAMSCQTGRGPGAGLPLLMPDRK
jgi:hypothetical protein